jgi:hypothetical protein
MKKNALQLITYDLRYVILCFSLSFCACTKEEFTIPEVQLIPVCDFPKNSNSINEKKAVKPTPWKNANCVGDIPGYGPYNQIAQN